MVEGTKVPQDLSYTSEHEWIRVESRPARVGITDYAQSELGDIVYVELPEVGREVSAGESVAVVESVKSVSDVYAPVDGRVVSVHDGIDPATVNSDPYGEGWMFEMDVMGGEEKLLSADEYRALIGKGEDQK
ncbi:MAG: glycine cleavage system protein GcvH [Candidatus Hydrogenedentota bacterium]|nr:MAG: glycine cleavage system protein GcvH [Candidatus Hydrogenedentota bacterium]